MFFILQKYVDYIIILCLDGCTKLYSLSIYLIFPFSVIDNSTIKYVLIIFLNNTPHNTCHSYNSFVNFVTFSLMSSLDRIDSS
nr:MAG TPA: hypothetical protein [Caudoviricetes sp.]